MSRVSVEIQDHIATVTLTRGDKMNALDPDMFDAIIGAGQQLIADDTVRAVVLHGEGRAFCAGLDIASMGALAGSDPADALMPRTYGDCNLFQYASMVWRDVPVPVIAAVHGTVYGGGFQIALGADMRIAAPGTKMSVMEMKWGIVPDMGGMVLMPHLARSDVIRRLTYTNEVFVAEQALDWGFVTEIQDDPLARAQELASTIAGKSPSAIRTAKRLIGAPEAATRADVLLAESREQAALIGKPHQMEVIAATMSGRPAKFD